MTEVFPPPPAPDPLAGTSTAPDPARDPGPRRKGGGRRWAAAGVAVGVIAAAVTAGAAAAAGAPAAAAGPASGPATATVARRSLSAQTEAPATLGDAGSFSVVNQAAGTVTALPAAGRVLRQGAGLYKVNAVPVILLYGRVPAWRTLSEGMTGADVTQLNTDLVALRYGSTALLGPRAGWDLFSAGTADALARLQSHLGLPVTGFLPLGPAVFLPSAVQVSELATGVVLGGTVQPGAVLLTATSTAPVVTVSLDAGQQAEVRRGDRVTVTLPDGAATPGVVASVGAVAAAPSSASSDASGDSGADGSGASDSGGGDGSAAATVTVIVTLRHPAAARNLNQAPVQAAITTGGVTSALVVPVNALLAQAGGGYAVEVASPAGRQLVAVTPGLFDDAAGLVQVTRTTLRPGQRVVVPRS
jgi:hypothetical protein